MSAASNTGRHLEMIDAAVRAGDLAEAARRADNLRTSLLMAGIRAVRESEPLSHEHEQRLNQMSLAILDASVAEHVRR